MAGCGVELDGARRHIAVAPRSRTHRNQPTFPTLSLSLSLTQPNKRISLSGSSLIHGLDGGQERQGADTRAVGARGASRAAGAQPGAARAPDLRARDLVPRGHQPHWQPATRLGRLSLVAWRLEQEASLQGEGPPVLVVVRVVSRRTAAAAGAAAERERELLAAAGAASRRCVGHHSLAPPSVSARRVGESRFPRRGIGGGPSLVCSSSGIDTIGRRITIAPTLACRTTSQPQEGPWTATQASIGRLIGGSLLQASREPACATNVQQQPPRERDRAAGTRPPPSL